ncbi:MAG: hypothetical protein KatS3mg015_2433 [Fimbriimonadales bacterium]|nr:MAG: hypothetical protein KatS3mg015_2433 [Fimbriimonadales bacterium]
MSRLPSSYTCHALQLKQGRDVSVYVFSLPAGHLLKVASISRVHRDDEGVLQGYQRRAVGRHIRDITTYLNGEDVLFPNNIILALSSEVTFRPDGRVREGGGVCPGRIRIPLRGKGTAPAGWIVDGQQRALALARSNKPDLPVPVSAFISDEVQLQRDQFLRINNTRALPPGLIHELLPVLGSRLPHSMEQRRVPSLLCDWLNTRKDSPFLGMIRRSSTPKSAYTTAVVRDTSLLLAIQSSLTSPAGCLFSCQNLSTGEADIEAIYQILQTYWSAVRDVFPEAWGRTPRQSRLMHGAGIRAMGHLMDVIMCGLDPQEDGVGALIRKDLSALRAHCRWTGGTWEALGDIPWNALQNTPQHVRRLSAYLKSCYHESLSAQ